MSQNIEDQIKNQEDKLFEFIELKIKNLIIIHLQSILTYKLICELQIKELVKLRKFEENCMQIIQKNFPLYHEFYDKLFGPLGYVYNGLNCHLDFMSYCVDKNCPIRVTQAISYLEFEEAGFSKDFVKRVTNLLEISGKIIKKKGLGPLIYSLPYSHILTFKNEIVWKAEAWKMIQADNCFRSENLDFIFSFFKKKYIDKVFSEICSQYFEEFQKEYK